MDFHNFFTIYVFKVKESIADIPTELPCLSDLDNPSQLPVREVLMILSYIFFKFLHYSYFKVRESIADISTELPCLGDLESPGIDIRFNRYSEVLVIVSCRFLKFLHCLRF